MGVMDKFLNYMKLNDEDDEYYDDDYYDDDEIIEENLRKGIINGYLRDRTLESHMSLKTTIETLQANDLGKVVTIVLLHLSDRNSNAKQFQNEVWLATGKPTFVAEPKLDIKFTKTPW